MQHPTRALMAMTMSPICTLGADGVPQDPIRISFFTPKSRMIGQLGPEDISSLLSHCTTVGLRSQRSTAASQRQVPKYWLVSKYWLPGVTGRVGILSAPA